MSSSFEFTAFFAVDRVVSINETRVKIMASGGIQGSASGGMSGDSPDNEPFPYPDDDDVDDWDFDDGSVYFHVDVCVCLGRDFNVICKLRGWTNVAVREDDSCFFRLASQNLNATKESYFAAAAIAEALSFMRIIEETAEVLLASWTLDKINMVRHRDKIRPTVGCLDFNSVAD